MRYYHIIALNGDHIYQEEWVMAYDKADVDAHVEFTLLDYYTEVRVIELEFVELPKRG